MLRYGNPPFIASSFNPPFIASSFTGATNVFTKSFSNVTSISVAAPLTHLEGDDKRLMTGNMNKSSSLGPQAALPLSYSAKANNIKGKKEKKKKKDELKN